MIAKLAFIAAHIRDHAISLMCPALGVSRSWFHAWHRTAPERAARAARLDTLVDEILTIFEESKQRYAHLASTLNCGTEVIVYQGRGSPG